MMQKDSAAILNYIEACEGVTMCAGSEYSPHLLQVKLTMRERRLAPSSDDRATRTVLVSGSYSIGLLVLPLAC